MSSMIFLQFKSDYRLEYALEDIQKYVEEKLFLQGEKLPANAVEGRSVMLVTSKRAGLGECEQSKVAVFTCKGGEISLTMESFGLSCRNVSMVRRTIRVTDPESNS